MLRLTFVIAGLLIALGVGFKFGTGSDSFTPLIPAFMGVVIAVCGGLACLKSPAWMRPAAMHLALVVALLGLLGSASMAVPGLITLASGGEVERLNAVIQTSVTSVLLVVYLAMGVKSFVDARRARTRATVGDAVTA